MTPAVACADATDPASQPVVVRVEQPRQPRGLMVTLIVLLSIVIVAFAAVPIIGGVAAKKAFDAMSDPLGSLGVTDMTGEGSDLGALFGEDVPALESEGIGVYHMSGVIGAGGVTAEQVHQVLTDAEADPLIKAVVVRIDSPGGEAAAGSEIASYIEEFSKPIVFSVGSMCASAGYLAASQSDWIVATDMSEVGSIGTIIESYEFSELLEKLGVSSQVVKSSAMKDMGSMSRPMTDEEKALLQEKVDRATRLFVEKVAQGRGTDVHTVQEWANGTTYFGTDALDKGLVDQVGTFEDALDEAANLAGLGDDYAIADIDPETDMFSSLGLGGLF